MKPAAATEKIEEAFRRTVADTPDVHNAHLLVQSGQRGLDVNVAAGGTDGVPAHPDQPFHAASVGKTFTATMIAQLVDAGELSFDDHITSYLPEDLLAGLHVYDGREYTDDIQIKHLLGHTSGLPHFHPEERGLFGRKREQSPSGETFFDVMLASPDRFWTPAETTEWAKHNLTPHFPPGKGRYYSEVGYNLLGVLIEAVTDTPYEEALHDAIFDPLDMTHSSLAQFSEPAETTDHAVAPFHIDDQRYDVDANRSFSAWFAGGQTVNTTTDLFRFHHALANGDLVDADTLAAMMEWEKLYMGIDYGYGLVRLRPLPFRAKYHAWGGLGATSAFSFYNPTLDVYLIGSFNQWNHMTKAMRFLLRTLRITAKVKPTTDPTDGRTLAA